MKEKYYKISEKKLKTLLSDQITLAALESAGVDNWSGYGYAFDEEENPDMNEDEYYDEYLDRITDKIITEQYKEIK